MARGRSYGRQRGGGGTVGGEVPGVDEDGEQAPAAESQPAEMAAEHEVQGSEDDSISKRHLRKGQESSGGPAISPHSSLNERAEHARGRRAGLRAAESTSSAPLNSNND